jgi:hypothetical protein
MIQPAAFDLATTPTVNLAGQAWPIPELVWRDLRKCRRELLELSGRLNDAIAASRAPPDETEAARGLRHMVVMDRVFDDLDNDDFDRLVMGVLHAGLVAAHPTLTRADFDAWPMTEAERRMAWLTVRRQSGLFVARRGGDEPGEGGGAA